MLTRLTIIALTTALMTASVHAADYSAMSPQELQAAAALAVDDEDGDTLLAVMQEMKSRNMLFFRKPKKEEGDECRRLPDPIGVGGTGFGPAVTRPAYELFMMVLAMKNGTCGCLTGAMTYREFLSTKFGYTPESLTKKEWIKMRDWKDSVRGDITKRYNAYYKANCRGE